MKRFLLCATVLLVGAVLTTSALSAPAKNKKLTVCASGCEYTTIAAALAAASDGAKIEVGRGTYETSVFIDKDIRIVGEGVRKTTVSGQPSPSPRIVFSVAAGVTASISDLTVHAGTAEITSQSAGIANGGTLDLKHVIVEDATGVFTFGIRNSGTMTLKDSIVRNNSTETVGGIYNNGHLTVKDSTVTGNTSHFFGGGIWNQGTLVVRHSTISNNSGATAGNPSSVGGGIVNEGDISLKKVTFINNTPVDCAGC